MRYVAALDKQGETWEVIITEAEITKTVEHGTEVTSGTREVYKGITDIQTKDSENVDLDSMVFDHGWRSISDWEDGDTAFYSEVEEIEP